MEYSAKTFTFYVSNHGTPLIGAAATMAFINLCWLDGTDKIANKPTIVEIGLTTVRSGWYGFVLTYGSPPFTQDLIGVIDADVGAVNGLDDSDRYIPIKVSQQDYLSSIGADGGVKISADSQDLSATLSVNAKLIAGDTPANTKVNLIDAPNATAIAAITTALEAAGSKLCLVYQWCFNRKKRNITAKQIILYADNGNDALKTKTYTESASEEDIGAAI
jgi:hypothetical protein